MTQEEYNKVYELIKDIIWNNDDDKASESLFEEILEHEKVDKLRLVIAIDVGNVIFEILRHIAQGTTRPDFIEAIQKRRCK